MLAICIPVFPFPFVTSLYTEHLAFFFLNVASVSPNLAFMSPPTKVMLGFSMDLVAAVRSKENLSLSSSSETLVGLRK